MQLTRTYDHLHFPVAVIRQVIEKMHLIGKPNSQPSYPSYGATVNGDDWQFDDIEDLLNAIPTATRASLRYTIPLEEIDWNCHLDLAISRCYTSVTVASKTRAIIFKIMNIFEEAKGVAIPSHPLSEDEPKTFKVFIGHGRSPAWQELKNHLQDKHEYDVVAFESGERAGHAIRDILTEMLDESSIALLVLTGEDETSDGDLRARQNVVHETGLFQGRLGFSRSIVLLEEGVEGFSNLHGIQHISFGKGRIRETFGDVLAVISREKQNTKRSHR